MQRQPIILLTLLLCAFWLSPVATSAEPTQGVPESVGAALSMLGEGQLSLGRHLQILEDPSRARTVEDVLREPVEHWLTRSEPVPNLGFTESAYWFRLTIVNDTPHAAQPWLEIGNPVLDWLDVYRLDPDGQIHHYRGGDQRAFTERPIAHRHFLVEWPLAAGQSSELLVRVAAEGSLQLPIDLWTSARFVERDQPALGFQWVFAGIMLALGFYNLMLLLVVRDASYGWYVLNVITIAVVQLSLHGLTFQFLWPEHPEWNNQILLAAITLNVACVGLFTYAFLDLRQRGWPIRRFVQGVIGVGLALCAASPILGYAQSIKLSVLVIVFAAPGLLMVGLYLALRGDALARLFTLAWSVLLLGHATIVLNKMGLLPRTILSEYAPQAGAALEVLLLSFALAYRINIERRQRFAAQAEALRAEQEARAAQADVLRVQKDANEQLEQRVQERTLALEEANHRLRELSSIDGLTQVRNRQYFDRTLAHEWRRSARESHDMSLLILDMDHFKQINDTYGHLCGDACLQQVARLYLEAVFRPADFVARYGGEEFVILLSNTPLQGAANVAERIRSLVENTPVIWEEQPIRITVSVGVASCVPRPFEEPATLIQRADEAMYAAKRAGRNRVMLHHCWSDGDTEHSEIRPYAPPAARG